MSSDLAIYVEKLGKCFQIYEKPSHRLWQMLCAGQKQFYREFWALKDVSFAIRKGEAVGIIGLNGSGKSTLLQMICGTLHPTTGNVKNYGRVAALLELGSGFNAEFTGRENVFLYAALFGLSQNEIQSRFAQIEAFADIGEFIDQPVKAYSSGMYVRLAFSVVANIDADILVIDEALSVGDAFFQQKCMRFLRAFKEKGTLIFVSHDSGAVINLCDRALWLNKGELLMDATPKDVADAYLANLYEMQQGESGRNFTEKIDLSDLSVKDLTQKFEQLDNFSSSFGTGEASIEEVWLENMNGEKITRVMGSEAVKVCIKCLAEIDLEQIIFGFQIKNRYGQVVFGDNTYLTFEKCPFILKKGEIGVAKFYFNMPFIQVGSYFIAAAVACGTQINHTQLHWLHEALFFEVHLDKYVSMFIDGIFRVPINNIEIIVNETIMLHQ